MPHTKNINEAADGGSQHPLVVPLRDALALVDFGPCRDAARPQDWINVAGPMCAHCEGTEDVNLAAARIIMAEYRDLRDVIGVGCDALFGSWVSVADRMPTGEDGEEWVIVLTKWGGMSVARRDWEQGHNPEFWHVSGPIRHRFDDVTHWMILPPLPNV